MSYFALSLRVEIWDEKGNILSRIVMFFLMLYGGSAFSQNEQMFSQTSFNPAFVNPAYAGADTGKYYNVIVMNRNQMAGIDMSPGTSVLNINGPLTIADIPGGVTVTFYDDRLGFLNTPAFNLGYAYKLEIEKGSLSLGLSAGIFFSTLNSESWRLPDGAADPAIPTGKESKRSFDLGLGAYYTNSKLYAGISVLHLVRPVLVYGDNPSKLPRSYYLMAGYRMPFENPDFELKPSLLVLTDLKSALYSINTLLFYRNRFWVGLDYRFKSSLGLLAGLNLFPELKLGYSYSYNTSLLSRYGGSNHEIMLTYRFSVYFDKGRQKYKSIRYL
ncbi:MAG: PorP/SprF family type IX secretion system membrane protein [Prevotellaceae bacterium]|jgi:type IX secretion system PorP/SprF family membrane protein|nr:PorP/SprF family type IX secretion system membrane protein [Prevotellaceae bacterium]